MHRGNVRQGGARLGDPECGQTSVGTFPRFEAKDRGGLLTGLPGPRRRPGPQAVIDATCRECRARIFYINGGCREHAAPTRQSPGDGGGAYRLPAIGLASAARRSVDRTGFHVNRRSPAFGPSGTYMRFPARRA